MSVIAKICMLDARKKRFITGTYASRSLFLSAPNVIPHPSAPHGNWARWSVTGWRDVLQLPCGGAQEREREIERERGGEGRREREREREREKKKPADL